MTEKLSNSGNPATPDAMQEQISYFSLRAAAAGIVLDGGEFQPMPIFEEPGAGGTAGNGELPYKDTDDGSNAQVMRAALRSL